MKIKCHKIQSLDSFAFNLSVHVNNDLTLFIWCFLYFYPLIVYAYGLLFILIREITEHALLLISKTFTDTDDSTLQFFFETAGFYAILKPWK